MTGMLCSVTDVAEARLALEGGADIIDLKDPARGALGALDGNLQRAVVQAVAGAVPVSATVGDLPPDAGLLAAAVAQTAAGGVDLVKIGLLLDPLQAAAPRDAAAAQVLSGLAAAARQVPLVAVFFADRAPQLEWIDLAAKAGFRGVMLDTADKAAGRLRDWADEGLLERFVRRAQDLGMLAGLAGSLRVDDVAPLLRLRPDYLGFRGALCGGRRTERMDPRRVGEVRRLMPASTRRATAGACTCL